MRDAITLRAEPHSGLFPKPPQNVKVVEAAELDAAAVEILTRLATAEGAQEAEALVAEAQEVLGSRADSLRPLFDRLSMRAQEVDTLRCLAGLDELTGVANRRAFEAALHRDLARSSRTGASIAVVLLDLDELKLLNDVHGHSAGDEAIRRVAETCASAVRGTDLVARLGGDEFAILLPDIDAHRTEVVASRIRERIEECEVAGRPLRISIGFAVTDGTHGANRLLELADQALYQDKRRRRQGRGVFAAA